MYKKQIEFPQLPKRQPQDDEWMPNRRKSNYLPPRRNNDSLFPFFRTPGRKRGPGTIYMFSTSISPLDAQERAH